MKSTFVKYHFELLRRLFYSFFIGRFLMKKVYDRKLVDGNHKPQSLYNNYGEEETVIYRYFVKLPLLVTYLNDNWIYIVDLQCGLLLQVRRTGSCQDIT